VARLADVSCHLGDASRAEILYKLLLPYVERTVTVGAALCDGSVARYLGSLATTMARWPEAEAHFQTALEIDGRLQAPPILARTQTAYAAMLLRRGRVKDRSKAQALLARARETATRIGMAGLLPEIAAAEARSEMRRVRGRGVVSRADLAGRMPYARTSGGARKSPATSAVFRRDGDFWSVGYGHAAFRVRDGRGMRYIAALVYSPGREVHVIDLVASVNGAHDPPPPTDIRAWAGNGVSVRREAHSGPCLDPQARSEYRQRIAALHPELEEARRMNDRGRVEALQSEIDFLSEQLVGDRGPGRKARLAFSSVERARINVRNSISAALKRIRMHDEALWRHLSNALRTGTFCSYRPEKPVRWEG
jgi:hypothetical protein